MTKEQTSIKTTEENIFSVPTSPMGEREMEIMDKIFIGSIDKVRDPSDEVVDPTRAINIFERLARITAEMDRVKKNLKIEMSKTRSYKAVSEGDILIAVKPLEEKYRVYSYPVSRKIIDTNVLTTVATYEGGGSKEKTELFLRMETVYRFVNMDDPSDFVDQTTYGDGIDSGDKAVGKAMTYSDKYALMKAYKIETGDDPDQEGSPELKSVGKVQPVEPKPEPKPEPIPSASTKQVYDLTVVCTEEEIAKIYNHYGIEKLEQLNEKQAQAMLNKKLGDPEAVKKLAGATDGA